jgi:signal peptidase I
VNLDFNAIFVAALAVTGMVVTADILIWKPRRASIVGLDAPAPAIASQARSLFSIILLVLLIRSFVFEPFRIPSASMMPGLVDGDFIVVDKFSYGLRLPILNTEILPIGAPQRGDVVVFRLPANPSVHYIKRLIGLPGDHIVVRDNRVFINGQVVPLKIEGSYAGGFSFAGAELGIERFGTAQHVLMFAPDRFATDFEAVVPSGQYFFMGDNRNDSQDS